MVQEKVQMHNLHFDHRIWLNELNFFSDEIGIFEHRLEEVAAKNSDSEVLAALERFQNQYIRQKDVLNKLKNDIRLHEMQISRLAQENPAAVKTATFPGHDDMVDQMETFKKLYQELRNDCLKFLIKYH